MKYIYLTRDHDDDDGLLLQIDVFEEQRLHDDEENDGIDLSSHTEVFQALFQKVVFHFIEFVLLF